MLKSQEALKREVQEYLWASLLQLLLKEYRARKRNLNSSPLTTKTISFRVLKTAKNLVKMGSG
jgi:hypothetical protein